MSHCLLYIDSGVQLHQRLSRTALCSVLTTACDSDLDVAIAVLHNRGIKFKQTIKDCTRSENWRQKSICLITE